MTSPHTLDWSCQPDFFVFISYWEAVGKEKMKNGFASPVTQTHKLCSHSRLFEASHAFPVYLIVLRAARCWRPGVWLQSPAIWLQSPVVWRQRWRQCWCHGTLWISAATATDCGLGLWALTVLYALDYTEGKKMSLENNVFEVLLNFYISQLRRLNHKLSILAGHSQLEW